MQMDPMQLAKMFMSGGKKPPAKPSRKSIPYRKPAKR